MDVTEDPCDDFFRFACGKWNRNHMIPEDRASISTFEVLSDQIQIILKGLFHILLLYGPHRDFNTYFSFILLCVMIAFNSCCCIHPTPMRIRKSS